MNENSQIKKTVLEKIQNGEIVMKPRLFFVLRFFSIILVSCLLLLCSSLLVSFIIFSLVGSGKIFLLGFGFRGFLMFFLLFPWPLLLLEIIFILLLEWMLKSFKIGYRSSLSKLVFVILLLSILVSVLILFTPLHRSLQNKTEKEELPFIGSYYRSLRRPAADQDIFVGFVSAVGTSSFVLNQHGNFAEFFEQKEVFLPVRIPTSTLPAVGDSVFVAGKLLPNGTISAYGFQIFPNLLRE